MELEFKKIEFHKKWDTELDYVEVEFVAMCYLSLEHSSTLLEFSEKFFYYFFFKF